MSSVVDVGCAVGVWLAVFRELGVSDVLGIDGYAPTEMLQIPESQFLKADLSQPLRLDRRFDLAICLEVVEHLPATSSDSIIESLTRLSDYVLFSAAIPFQGGNGHINEQWPDYWISRFAKHGYVPIDCIRPRIWNDPRVTDHSYHFAQNLLLLVDERRLAENPKLCEAYERTDARLSIVHPRFFLDRADPANLTLDPAKAKEYKALSFMMAWRCLPELLKKAIRNRL